MVVIYPINFSSYLTFFKLSFLEIEFRNKMTDFEDKLNVGKIVFDGNNQERKSWSRLGQICSRSLIVFLSKLFVILLIIFGCLWKIHLPKTCDESTVSVGSLCSAPGYILFAPRLWTSQILQKKRVFFHLLVLQKLENRRLITIG